MFSFSLEFSWVLNACNVLFYRAVFKLSDKGILTNDLKKKCVRPVNGRAVAGAKLELAPSANDCHKFEFTTLGSLRHVQSRLCIQPPNMVCLVSYVFYFFYELLMSEYHIWYSQPERTEKRPNIKKYKRLNIFWYPFNTSSSGIFTVFFGLDY